MDSNQTRFHLLLDQDNWARATDRAGSSILDGAAEPAEFSWDRDRFELTLGKRANVFHSAPGNQPPTLGQRRGAAQDRYGNMYSIADSGMELLVNSSGTGATTHFWASPDEISQRCDTPDGTFGVCRPEAPPVPLRFSGLAVTEQHYLVAGVLEPAGFVVFDLFHGGPPRQFVWPSAIPFAPFELAAAPGGGVWILDRANHRLWALDRTFAVIRQDQVTLGLGPRDVFSPADGTPAPARPAGTFPAGISLDLASPLGSIDAIALAALPDGSVLLLESDPAAPFSLIYRLRYGQRLGVAVSLALVLDHLALEDRAGFTLLGYDFAFIAVERTPFGRRQNILYVVGQNGDQAWAFTPVYDGDQLGLSHLPEFYPMRLFGGRALAAGTSQVYYDSQNRWTPLIIQQRPRYAVEGTLFTPVLDGKQPDCVWHKLILDACIPSDTSVQVWSRAHNDKQYLEIQNFLPEPGPYPRQDGSELPWVPETPGLDAWELLFQRASGRYLQLQIVLSGNGKLTPRVRALRAYYPRFSYRDHYLPAVYRENQQSASFVERFLANIEGFFTSIEDKIGTVQALLDPRSAPSDTLDWLANWFGVALDPAWTESKRRLFLRHAAQFFEARGTLPGLTMALRLTLEDCADESVFAADPYIRTGLRIVEKFRTRRLPVGLFDDATGDAGLPVKLRTGIWTPSQGADDLDRRYRDALALPAGAAYPIAMSAADAVYASWNSFSTAALGFTPSQPDSSNANLWTAFLRSRYGAISTLNSAYNATYRSFDLVPFPQALPRQPQPLLDWYQFQGALLVDAAAHQFAVYLPMPAADAQNTLAHRAKMNLAKRVLDLEKPAHTTYEIKFYWAFFRVGDARLGEDSVLDRGSRAPQLFLPAVLGDTYAGSAFISRERPGEPRVRPFLKSRSCERHGLQG
jgi:phage tail-like protein